MNDQRNHPLRRDHSPFREARDRRLRLFVLTCAAVAVPIVAIASPVVIPHEFMTGETIIASEFNENFDELADAINDNDERLSQVEMDVTEIGGEGLPSGALVFFDVEACPPGWSELTAMRGRVPLGLPVGGTLGATVGLDLDDEGTRTINQVPSHQHGSGGLSVSVGNGGSHTHTSQNAGSHAHSINNAGSHTHMIDNGGSHDHQIRVEYFGDYDTYAVSGVQNSPGGTTTYSPIISGGSHGHTMQAAGTHNHTMGSAGVHSHTINAGGTHNHTATVGGNTASAGVASVDVTMPYMQLLACAKD